MQAGRAKWTRESFIADHSYWLQNFDTLIQAQQEVSTLRLQFTSNYPPKEPPVTAQSLPRFVHSENDGTNTCQFCNDGRSFSTYKSLTQHKIDLHPETMFACPHPSCRTDKSDSQHRFFFEPRLLISHYICKHNEKTVGGSSICNFNGCRTSLSHKGTSSFSRHVDRVHNHELFEISAQLYNKNNVGFISVRPARDSIERAKERFENKKRTLQLKIFEKNV